MITHPDVQVLDPLQAYKTQMRLLAKQRGDLAALGEEAERALQECKMQRAKAAAIPPARKSLASGS